MDATPGIRRVRLPRRTGQTITCAWCGTTVPVLPPGRPPQWCSPACRHRAWEQAGAAASGRSAAEVVTHFVEVERPAVVAKPVVVETTPTGAAWSGALLELARQIDVSRVYDRDLRDLAEPSTSSSRRSTGVRPGGAWFQDRAEPPGRRLSRHPEPSKPSRPGRLCADTEPDGRDALTRDLTKPLTGPAQPATPRTAPACPRCSGLLPRPEISADGSPPSSSRGPVPDTNEPL